MTQYKIITFLISVCVALCLIGIGAFLSYKSTLGVISCIALAVVLMGVGFSLKRKHIR
jgi:uncharacterized membrane protein